MEEQIIIKQSSILVDSEKSSFREKHYCFLNNKFTDVRNISNKIVICKFNE